MQHIAFDIGDVVMHIDFSPFYKVLIEIGMTEMEIFEFVKDYERANLLGVFTVEQGLRNKFPVDFSDGKIVKFLPDIEEAWNKSIYPNEMMMNFIINLKNEGIKVAFLSNIGQEHAHHIRTTYSDVLNNCIQHFSFEVGAFKPQMLYYQSFLLNNEDFAGCVYLDDRKENIVAAAKQKFDAIQFDLKELKKPIEVRKALDKIKDRMQKGW